MRLHAAQHWQPLTADNPLSYVWIAGAAMAVTTACVYAYSFLH